MATSRNRLAPYLGERIRVSAYLTNQQRGRLTLLQDIRLGKLSLTQYLWVELTEYRPAGQYFFEGMISKYIRLGTLSEDYSLQKVVFR